MYLTVAIFELNSKDSCLIKFDLPVDEFYDFYISCSGEVLLVLLALPDEKFADCLSPEEANYYYRRYIASLLSSFALARA